MVLHSITAGGEKILKLQLGFSVFALYYRRRRKHFENVTFCCNFSLFLYNFLSFPFFFPYFFAFFQKPGGGGLRPPPPPPPQQLPLSPSLQQWAARMNTQHVGTF